MKTVLTQLIEELNGNSFQELFSNQNYIKEYLETRIESIYLDIEKEQMMEAWESGYSNGVRSVSRGEPKIKSSAEYYTQTFKSDE